jgi:aryl-alcohol dehydrogenase-like predicted oxidoreductase
MKYHSFSETGPMMSTIALGCWPLIGDQNWGHQDEGQSLETIAAARDCGITLFDTAPGYGNGASEELLGRALRGWRDQALVATKAPPKALSPGALQSSCDASLQRLQTDYIDLYQFHWPNHDVPMAESIGALEKLRNEGKIRQYGVCNFGLRDLGDFLAAGGRCLTNQLAYSLLARAIEYAVQPKCVEEKIGILCYSPLAQGLLTGKFRHPDDVPDGRARTRHFSRNRPQVRHGEEGCETETFAAIESIRTIAAGIGESMEAVSLAWLLEQPGISSVIAGARTADQIRKNAAAADLSLDPATVEALNQSTESVKKRLGDNPDLWQAALASRMR